MILLGVDLGIHGGLALITFAIGEPPRLITAIDIPVAGLKARERVDVLAIRTWLTACHPITHCVIERAQAMPKQGASSGFKYGRSVGSIEATITCSEIPLSIIEPTAWKKFHGLRGSEKELSRQRVLQLFPAQHALFARKQDHGRAEAVLIALAGMKLVAIGASHAAAA